jgi:Bacterial SH3 domain
MIKTFAFVFLAAASSAAYATAAYAVVPPVQNKDTQTRCLIQGDGLNIRETPDLEGDLVATLERSDTVIRHRIVTGREGRKWAYVEVPGDDGSKGWVSYKYLTCQGSQPHEARPQRRVRYYGMR